jgi:hypothetical protein
LTKKWNRNKVITGPKVCRKMSHTVFSNATKSLTLLGLNSSPSVFVRANL